MLDKLHEGHQGVVKFCTGQVTSLVARAEQTARRACDELHSVSIYKVRSYLLVMDYYSTYVDIAKLDTVASSDVSNH